MLVRQPLHDAQLLAADIHGQDEKGVRPSGAVSADAQWEDRCSVKEKDSRERKLITYHAQNINVAVR